MILGILPVDPIVEIIVFVALGVIAISAAIAFLVYFLYYGRKQKMYAQIDALFTKFCQADPDNRSYERVNEDEYDYKLTTKYRVIYIMVVPNAESLEIKINSSTKWQYRRGSEDNTVRFLNRVENLMRFDPAFEDRKIVKRLYIIYPNVKSILRLINECEMEFVRPDTDINGTFVVTYNELVKNPELIEL